ncbi:MAG: class I SAM-dependent methyltransferase [Armatimonadetes bacterium]|nr:class I SAM-dependent methyltransferase [Armatimonadota bacterium]
MDSASESERQKYEQMWDMPEYRQNFDGVKQAEEFVGLTKAPKGSSFIDFGCGPGYASSWLIEHGYKVLGIDIASNALKAPTIPFLCCSMWEMPVELRSDYGFCTDVMEHIPPERVDDVLALIAKSVAKETYLDISFRVDGFGDRIGKRLHLTVQSPEWWMERLKKHWRNVQLLHENKEDRSGAFMVSKPRRKLF